MGVAQRAVRAVEQVERAINIEDVGDVELDRGGETLRWSEAVNAVDIVNRAIGEEEHLALTTVGRVVVHVGAVILLVARTETDDEALQDTRIKLVAVDDTVSALGVADRRFTGAADDERAAAG